MIEFNNKRYEQKCKFYSWKLSINNHMRLQTHFSRKRSLKRNDVVLYSLFFSTYLCTQNHQSTAYTMFLETLYTL